MPAPASRPPCVAGAAAERRDEDMAAPDPLAENDRLLREVRRVRGSLRYGSARLVVQDGRVVQADTTSRLRLSVGRGSELPPLCVS